jgi:hypothetical protein
MDCVFEKGTSAFDASDDMLDILRRRAFDHHSSGCVDDREFGAITGCFLGASLAVFDVVADIDNLCFGGDVVRNCVAAGVFLSSLMFCCFDSDEIGFFQGCGCGLGDLGEELVKLSLHAGGVEQFFGFLAEGLSTEVRELIAEFDIVQDCGPEQVLDRREVVGDVGFGFDAREVHDP